MNVCPPNVKPYICFTVGDVCWVQDTPLFDEVAITPLVPAVTKTPLPKVTS